MREKKMNNRRLIKKMRMRNRKNKWNKNLMRMEEILDLRKSRNKRMILMSLRNICKIMMMGKWVKLIQMKRRLMMKRKIKIKKKMKMEMMNLIMKGKKLN